MSTYAFGVVARIRIGLRPRRPNLGIVRRHRQRAIEVGEDVGVGVRLAMEPGALEQQRDIARLKAQRVVEIGRGAIVALQDRIRLGAFRQHIDEVGIERQRAIIFADRAFMVAGDRRLDAAEFDASGENIASRPIAPMIGGEQHARANQRRNDQAGPTPEGPARAAAIATGRGGWRSSVRAIATGKTT